MLSEAVEILSSKKVSELPVVDSAGIPIGLIDITDVISLMRAGADTQAVQLVTLAGAGEIVITLHQPHLRPRSVTGYGVCADRSAEADDPVTAASPAPGRAVHARDRPAPSGCRAIGRADPPRGLPQLHG